MSWWTHLTGTITVSPIGRTQPEKRYILDTVLEHLPAVTGSEEDMHIYVIQKEGTNSSCSHDEFGHRTNNLTNHYGCRDRKRGMYRMQDEYIIVIDGDFRDRMLSETVKEFMKWICRLSKRVIVENVLVEIRGDSYENKSIIIRDENNAFYQMFEPPSWVTETKEPNWCEYLLWENDKDSWMPRILKYKYYKDPKNDKKVEDWLGFSDKKEE